MAQTEDRPWPMLPIRAKYVHPAAVLLHKKSHPAGVQSDSVLKCKKYRWALPVNKV